MGRSSCANRGAASELGGLPGQFIMQPTRLLTASALVPPDSLDLFRGERWDLAHRYDYENSIMPFETQLRRRWLALNPAVTIVDLEWLASFEPCFAADRTWNYQSSRGVNGAFHGSKFYYEDDSRSPALAEARAVADNTLNNLTERL